jgi:hypothetical protein
MADWLATPQIIKRCFRPEKFAAKRETATLLTGCGRPPQPRGGIYCIGLGRRQSLRRESALAETL